MSPEVNHVIETYKEIYKPFGLTCIILYGSFARNEEKQDSDIDLCFIFESLDSDKKKQIREAEFKDKKTYFDKLIDKVLVSKENFIQEKYPIHTAIKRTGIIIFGTIDMTESDIPYKAKYKNFFEMSKEFEKGKVDSAEFILNKTGSASVDFLYVPAKHTIQASLAMVGKGFSSRFEVLYELCKLEFGKEISDEFSYLHKLSMNEFKATREDFIQGFKSARKIFELYERIK